MKKYTQLLVFCYLIAPCCSPGQLCSSLNIQSQDVIASVCGTMFMTMKHDITGRPLLYIAAKEGGLLIYDVNAVPAALVGAVGISNYDSLHVMNLSQSGNFVYLALGNHFSTGQRAGVAIVDVSAPANAFVTSFWTDSGSVKGSAIVETEGNFAYLGAMDRGMIILDITDKNNIHFKSRIIPSLTFPDAVPDSAKINARGMQVLNDVVYLCYDAGGLRIINVSDKLNPVETGRFSNPALNGKPRAYNNIIVSDSIAYIAVDFCGIEILNIADTGNISLISWWNPWNCETNPLNWFSSPGHCNELKFEKNCGLLFISTGKSDMHILNVTDPANPDSCSIFGGVSNNIGTWGVDVFGDQIFLSYVCSVIPFSSSWTGVKILGWNNSCTTRREENPENYFSLFPNPARDRIQVSGGQMAKLEIVNYLGEIVTFTLRENSIELQSPSSGIYFFKLMDDHGRIHTEKVLIL